MIINLIGTGTSNPLDRSLCHVDVVAILLNNYRDTSLPFFAGGISVGLGGIFG